MEVREDNQPLNPLTSALARPNLESLTSHR